MNVCSETFQDDLVETVVAKIDWAAAAAVFASAEASLGTMQLLAGSPREVVWVGRLSLQAEKVCLSHEVVLESYQRVRISGPCQNE